MQLARQKKTVDAVTIFIPGLRTESEMNQRGWRMAHERRCHQRGTVAMYLVQARNQLEKLRPKYFVTMTRHGRKLLDDDNLAGSFKFIRDEIALRLGVDDGDTARIKFDPQQVVGKQYAVEIRIAHVPEVQQ